MTKYQLFLLLTLIGWPIVIFGILFLMSRLEDFVKRADAQTPEEAGLEPVTGSPPEKEVRIVFGDQVVGASSGNRRAALAPQQRTEERVAGGGSD